MDDELLEYLYVTGELDDYLEEEAKDEDTSDTINDEDDDEE